MISLRFERMAPDPKNPVLGDWLDLRQICRMCDISVRTSQRILARFRFDESETVLTTDMTSTGLKPIRVFSWRGALKLVMLSDSPKRGDVAMAIIDWAMKKEERIPSRASMLASAQPPGRNVIQTLDEVERLLRRGELTVQAVDELRSGRKVPLTDETMEALADEGDPLRKMAQIATAGLSALNRRAMALGYPDGEYARYCKARKRRIQQPQLPYGAEARHAGD